MELSIDTSTKYASVALSHQGEVITELTWHSQRNHSVELVPAIRNLTRRSGVQMDKLDSLFVARGPGAFSALRVGISTAKAMALALEVPLVSIGTIDIEAEPYIHLGVPICVVIRAGRNRFYFGKYDNPHDNAPPVYDVVSSTEMASHIQSNSLFCGEGIYAIAGIIKEKLGDDVQIAEVPPPTRRAGLLAQMGHRQLQTGCIDDLATLQPIYLRSAQINSARKKWRKN